MTFIGNRLMTKVQDLNEAVCIIPWANFLGKGMNLSLLPPAINKYYNRLGSQALKVGKPGKKEIL